MESLCELCPRMCRVDRRIKPGFCGMREEIRLARAALHFWEEPCISGNAGSGTIFFCGCNLGCVFCQNKQISLAHSKNDGASLPGKTVSDKELENLMLKMQESGAHNINLVTPTHYASALLRVLPSVRKKLKIPIIYNCGGYERVETIRKLEGLVDVYLPDIKYFSPELSKKYSGAHDYANFAFPALYEMVRQTGKISFDEEGLVKKGVIVRHLVLPFCRKDSALVLEGIARTVNPSDIRVSIMSQYTPDFAPDEMRELKRKITGFEYDFVMKETEKYGFLGYFQSRSSASRAYTPDFKEVTF